MHLTLAKRTHTREHTNNPNPVLCSSNERALQHTNEHGQVVEAHSVNAPKPSQAVSGKKLYIERERESETKKRVPCSAFRCARP